MRQFFMAGLAALLLASQANAEQDPGVACSQAMSDQARFASIAKKLPLKDLRDVTMPMLADRTFATAKERMSLAEWFKLHDDCAKGAEAVRRTMYPPKLFNTITVGDDRLRDIGGDIYARRITFGEANKRLVALKNELLEQAAEIAADQRAAQDAAAAQARQELEDAKAQAAKAQAQAAESQARQAEAQATQEQAQAYARAQADAVRQAELDRRRAIIMQMIQNNRPYQLPLPPPVQPLGGTNCTTSYIGAQAYTHCN